jgi:hypothetical protein
LDDRRGAAKLFEEDLETPSITYDDTALDKLLDRSQVDIVAQAGDSVATDDLDGSFTVSRVFETGEEINGVPLDKTQTETDVFWEKLLKERHGQWKKEQEAQFGRGKRARKPVRYNEGADDESSQQSKKNGEQDEYKHVKEISSSSSEADDQEEEDFEFSKKSKRLISSSAPLPLPVESQPHPTINGVVLTKEPAKRDDTATQSSKLAARKSSRHGTSQVGATSNLLHAAERFAAHGAQSPAQPYQRPEQWDPYQQPPSTNHQPPELQFQSPHREYQQQRRRPQRHRAPSRTPAQPIRHPPAVVVLDDDANEPAAPVPPAVPNPEAIHNALQLRAKILRDIQVINETIKNPGTSSDIRLEMERKRSGLHEKVTQLEAICRHNVNNSD